MLCHTGASSCRDKLSRIWDVDEVFIGLDWRCSPRLVGLLMPKHDARSTNLAKASFPLVRN